MFITKACFIGAMMKVTVNEKVFTKSALDRLVSSMLDEDGQRHGVQSYSYRSGKNELHLTIVDNSTNERSVSIAKKLYDYLIKGKQVESSLTRSICFTFDCFRSSEL